VKLDNLTPMRAMTDLRATIDAFAARYAARRVDEGAEIETLLSAFEQMQQACAAGDYERFDQTDTNLHLTIIDMAQVDGLDETWRIVAARMKPFHIETLRACWPDLNVLFEAHRPIVDAICDGDGVAAEDAARAHLDAVWYRLAEHTADASLPDDPVARASAYIAFHLSEQVRLDFLARHVAGISAGHLARLFRETHGMSFTDYLRELRLQKAADQLRQTSLPIHRIAASVGYQDGSRFAQHFKKRFSITPRAYRRQFSERAGDA